MRATIAIILGLMCATRPALAQAPTEPTEPAEPAEQPAPIPPVTPATPATPPPVTATTIAGVVTARENGAPQLAASVGIPALGLYVFTGDKGEYSMPVYPGTYLVRVEAAGRFALEKTV